TDSPPLLSFGPPLSPSEQARRPRSDNLLLDEARSRRENSPREINCRKLFIDNEIEKIWGGRGPSRGAEMNQRHGCSNRRQLANAVGLNRTPSLGCARPSRVTHEVEIPNPEPIMVRWLGFASSSAQFRRRLNVDRRASSEPCQESIW